ncbi:MAG: Rpn family recombination-promoting nuclease/putative transposase [Bacteroidales bacterium]|nr:Rpn family recombination-promoting nuclease/putative transposase [Bacteroidales bacterium]
MKNETNPLPVPGRFANVLLDYWFKRTFYGNDSRKRLLILFLNELIPERDIVDLTYATQEGINPYEDRKGIRVDVECTDTDGRRFVVEMQRAEQDDFFDRAVFYSSFAVQKQVPSGDGAYAFPSVYFIGIMDFSLHPADSRFCFRYQLREEKSPELVMTEHLKYIFLELPKCRLTPGSGVLEKFGYALHNLARLERKPEGLEAEIFRLLFESADIATFTPEERIRYQNDMTTERDIRNQIAFAEKKGLKEGLLKGEARGEAKGRKAALLETARQMKAEGIPSDVIQRVTGFSEAEL